MPSALLPLAGDALGDAFADPAATGGHGGAGRVAQLLVTTMRLHERPGRQGVMGCLFAIFAGIFPRLALFIVWIARPKLVDAAFDTWIVPLLGIIFFPFATLIYVILYTPGVGLTGWEWFWVVVAGVLDLAHWGASFTQRRQVPGRAAA
jgi:hypothetical protein